MQLITKKTDDEWKQVQEKTVSLVTGENCCLNSSYEHDKRKDHVYDTK